MEMIDVDKCVFFNRMFKIDLIVWKSAKTKLVKIRPAEFKIDLIVWKYIIECTVMNK